MISSWLHMTRYSLSHSQPSGWGHATLELASVRQSVRGQNREGRATLHLLAHTLLAADQKSRVYDALKEKSPPPSLPASQPAPFSVSSISQPFCRCSSHPFCILFALSGCILEPAFSVHSPLFIAPWVHHKDGPTPHWRNKLFYTIIWVWP